MMTTHDLDEHLEAMFAAQAKALTVPDREWSDLPAAPARRPVARARRLGLVGVAAFAAILTVVAVPRLSSDDVVIDASTSPSTALSTAVPVPVPVPPILFETQQVSLRAQAIKIEVGGKQFATTTPMDVNGDPGTPEYTTLELTWWEHGVEMRMNIYFKSDGGQWWSEEIRTYNGKKQGDWAYYRGDFFRSPLGQPFVGDLDVTAATGGPDDGASGRLRIPGLRLEAFTLPDVCTSPASPYALSTGVDGIQVERSDGGGGPAGYGLAVKLLDTATCSPVADPETFAYAWRSEDPTVAAVTADGTHADISGRQVGATWLVVTAARRDSGETVAEARVKVDVFAAGTGPVAGSAVIADAPSPSLSPSP